MSDINTDEQKQISISPSQTIDKLSEPLLNMPLEIEDTVYKLLISQFVIQETNPSLIENIFIGIYQKTYSIQSNSLNYYINYLNKLCETHDIDNNGLNELELVLNKTYDKRKAKEIFLSIKDVFRYYENEESVDYRIEVGTDNFICLNPHDKTVELRHEKLGKSELNTYQIMISAYPVKIIIHDSPLDSLGRTFSIYWKTKYSNKIFKTENKTISEIGSDLKEGGYVLNKRKLDDTLASVINIAIKYQKAILRDEIEEDGFFYDENKGIIQANYEVLEPSEEKVKKSIKMIYQLLPYFDGYESKLATSLKWGLISAFSYAIKQLGGHLFPYLYCYGRAGSGKSTIGKIILYLWSEPNVNNDLGGSSVNSIAQLGNRISQSTLPILINEPEGVFSNPQLVAMIKSSIESTISRGRYFGNTYKPIPSFAPMIFTANQELPNGDALARRFEKIVFRQNEKKDKSIQKKFDNEFRIESPKNCLLHDLKGLSNFVAWKIMQNPKLLKEDWKDLSNYLIKEAFSFINEEAPQWILSWEEEIEGTDLDYQEVEEIRNYLLNLINDKYNKKINLKVVEEVGYTLYEKKKLDDYYDEVLITEDFEKKVFSVINQHLIPFMSLGNKRDGNTYVYFNSTFRKELSNNTDVSTNYDLKSIAQLLGWDYGQASVNGVKGVRMYIKFEDFLEFLYPQIKIDD